MRQVRRRFVGRSRRDVSPTASSFSTWQTQAATWSVDYLANSRASSPSSSYPFRHILSLEGHESARERLASLDDYERTPLVEAPADFAKDLGIASLLVKDETDRLGLGSFKGLGGILAVESVVVEAASSPTIVTASAGNHGIGVAAGASRANVDCVVYVHEGVGEAQADRIRAQGARVVRVEGTSYEASLRQCRADAAARDDWHVVQDVSGEGYERVPKRIWEGYTMVAREMIDQLIERGDPLPTHIFVNTGVGGFANALCGYLWERLGSKRPSFVVVEPTASACHLESARAGRKTRAACEDPTIQVGLDCKEVDPAAYELLTKGANHFVAVPDESVRPCVALLEDRVGVRGGESAVAGLAAIAAAAASDDLREALELDESSRVAIVACEGRV